MVKLLNFIKKLYTCRSIIAAMAWRDIKSRYAGTAFGLVWSVVSPLMLILVYWFVFSVGFKVQLAQGVPWIVVFICGMVPWMMFTETILCSMNAISANANLLKRTVFPSEILPVVSLVAACITHAIMLIVLSVVMIFNHVSFTVYCLQVIYYFFALSIFALGLAWLCSAVNVFFKDVGPMMAVLLNLWFWLTPIAWPLNILPQKYQFFVKLNPVFYIVEGYKNSFSYPAPLWLHYKQGLYFWSVCLLCFVVGATVFRRLKSEFAEAL